MCSACVASRLSSGATRNHLAMAAGCCVRPFSPPRIFINLLTCSIAWSSPNAQKGISFLFTQKFPCMKLSGFDVHNALLRWVAAFLEGRTQFISLMDATSTARVLNGGIPQGTKLGPLLFAIMVNDLVSSWVPRAKYVDDLTVLEVVPRNSPSMLNFIVNEIESYAISNNMRLNPLKCKELSVDFLRYNSCSWQPIAVGGAFHERVSCFKLLGVYISEDLS